LPDPCHEWQSDRQRDHDKSGYQGKSFSHGPLRCAVAAVTTRATSPARPAKTGGRLNELCSPMRRLSKHIAAVPYHM
jgi:hypothetical protein